jgi:hypothetical protein
MRAHVIPHAAAAAKEASVRLMVFLTASKQAGPPQPARAHAAQAYLNYCAQTPRPAATACMALRSWLNWQPCLRTPG